jgi:hypothetical protein
MWSQKNNPGGEKNRDARWLKNKGASAVPFFISIYLEKYLGLGF